MYLNFSYVSVLISNLLNRLEYLQRLKRDVSLILLSHSHDQQFTQPSRIPKETSTLIDYMLTSQTNRFVVGLLIADISDHFPSFIVDKTCVQKIFRMPEQFAMKFNQ